MDDIPGGLPVIHVCVTCGRDGDAPTRGQRLHDALAQRAAGLHADVRPVNCLAVCDRGCGAAVSMPGRWSWLLGRLEPGSADDLLTYLGLYAASKTGTVMPSRRPPALADMVIGRLPASAA